MKEPSALNAEILEVLLQMARKFPWLSKARPAAWMNCDSPSPWNISSFFLIWKKKCYLHVHQSFLALFHKYHNSRCLDWFCSYQKAKLCFQVQSRIWLCIFRLGKEDQHDNCFCTKIVFHRRKTGFIWMEIITYTIEFFIPMFEDIFFIFCLDDENNCTSVDTSRNLTGSINARLSVL